ncbi:MAG: AAA family ATPase [Myxococcota bacterium]|jgi:predicted ATPase|nr:AAA family ATPase [Myxococcota bacterium]
MPSARAATPRVRRIEIRGLFRQYHHQIDLRSEERVTILHGRNGVGKTMTLSLLHALFRGDYERFFRVPFESFRVELSDGSFLQLLPKPKPRKERTTPNHWTLEYSLPGASKRTAPILLALEYSLHGAPKKNVEIEFEQLVPNSWLKRDEAEELRRSVPSEELGLVFLYEERDLIVLRQQLRVHFVESQRLLKLNVERVPDRDGPMFTSTMSDISEEMGKRLIEVDSAYRKKSTELDNTLPSRLFAPAPEPISSLQALKEGIDTLAKERKRLTEMGLLADTNTPSLDPDALDETRRTMFGVYLSDNKEKLAVFKELADRAEILLGIVNHKFAPKRIILDREKGYHVSSHDGQTLELDMLSSGEQHELVLLHNLLFRVEPGALLLIDEPELSLHVTWQIEFLDDLIRIAKTVGFDALVATHSPYIAGQRDDLLVSLGAPE